MKPLTSRERILNTIEGRPVDRVAVAPFIHINHLREVFGARDLDFVEKTVEIYGDYGFDMIHRNCTPAYDDLALAGENWECSIEIIELNEVGDTDTFYRIRTPGGELTQKVSARWTCPWDQEVGPVEFLIKEERDLALLRKYQPPVGVIDTTPISRARALVGERGITAPWMQGVYNFVGLFLRRLDDLLVDPFIRPEFFADLMNYALERSKGIAAQYVESGTDMISVGINIGSGKMIDPVHLAEYIAPYEKELIAFIQSRGVGVIAHNCGCARNLLPVYADWGMKIYESLTPPPHGDTDLAHAVATLGPHTTLMGGIDQIDLLRTGSLEQIERTVREAIETTRGRCRYILATTDYFNEHTPREKIIHFSECGRKYGEKGAD